MCDNNVENCRNAANNTVVSSSFLVWKFCGKAQVSSSFLVWKFCGKAQFPNRPKLCGNCVFPQNFHTMRLSEITLFFAVRNATTYDFTLQNLHYIDCAYPTRNYMFKVNNRNTRIRCKISSKSTIKTPEQRHGKDVSAPSFLHQSLIISAKHRNKKEHW